VVYNVFVTTRREEVVMVEFSGARTVELETSIDDSPELTGADTAADELIRTAPVELTKALLEVAVP
jgi:hypothetical protein